MSPLRPLRHEAACGHLGTTRRVATSRGPSRVRMLSSYLEAANSGNDADSPFSLTSAACFASIASMLASASTRTISSILRSAARSRTTVERGGAVEDVAWRGVALQRTVYTQIAQCWCPLQMAYPAGVLRAR